MNKAAFGRHLWMEAESQTWTVWSMWRAMRNRLVLKPWHPHLPLAPLFFDMKAL